MHKEKHAFTLALPEYKEKIHSLENSNPHFAKLVKYYQGMTQEIHFLETKKDAALDAPIEDLKKKRLLKMDEVLKILRSSNPR